jgi:hypothetical protein
VANVAITGGSGSYFAASANSAVLATIASDNRTGVIRRARSNPPTQTAPANVDVAFSDGITSRLVTVVVTTPGQGPCP